jgi:tRNA (adenine22-N1)-methyltransferase
MVPPRTRVADIGTDHGRLPALLLATGRALHCVATDLPRDGTGNRLAFDDRWAGLLEFRAGFGLRVLEARDEIEVVLLTGLGARTMVRILEDRSPREIGASRLVLQPQSEPARIRRWLHQNDYGIVDEKLIRERGRYYFVLAAEPLRTGREPLNPSLWPGDVEEAGPCLLRTADPLVREYWLRVRRDQQRILLRGARGSGRVIALHRLELARRVLAVLPRQEKLGDEEGSTRAPRDRERNDRGPCGA